MLAARSTGDPELLLTGAYDDLDPKPVPAP